MTKRQINIYNALNADSAQPLKDGMNIDVAYVSFNQARFKEKDGSMKQVEGVFIIDNKYNCYRTSAAIIVRQLHDLVDINGSRQFDESHAPTIVIGTGGKEGQYLKIKNIS